MLDCFSEFCERPKEEMLEDTNSLRLSTLKCSVVKFKDGFLSVPVFLVDSFNLLNYGIKQEGVFRKSGNAQRVKMIKYPFFGEFGLPEGTNIYDVCDLIKQFFREIEDPLFTEGLEPQFLKYHTMSREDIRIRYILELCHILPPRHRETLSFLMRHLKRVASYSEFNKMNQNSLAVVFVPSIFRSQSSKISLNCSANPELDVQMQKRETQLRADLLEILIQHAEEICVLSEYEKIMSPDMYDKLLPEDRISFREMAENSVKREACHPNGAGRKNEGATPVSSKSRPSIKKRKSTTETCEGKVETFQDKLDVVDEPPPPPPPPPPSSSSSSEMLENSEKKRRSTYSATMKKMSLMAKREVDMKLNDSQVKRGVRGDAKIGGGTKNVNSNNDDEILRRSSVSKQKTSKRRSFFARRRTVSNVKLTPVAIKARDNSIDSIKDVSVVVQKLSTTDMDFSFSESVSDEVFTEPDKLAEETTNQNDEVPSIAKVSAPIQTLENAQADIVDEFKRPLAVSIASVDSSVISRPTEPAVSMQIPRSQSESSTIGHKKSAAGVRVAKNRRRAQTSPRKKLRRNVANVGEKPTRSNKGSSQKNFVEEISTVEPSSEIEKEVVTESSPSVDMGFKDSEARKEVLLQQTDNTDAAIIDVPLSHSAVPDYVSSPAALHRPSVAFIVNEKRGIVRQNLFKFEEIAKTGQNTLFIKSPSKNFDDRSVEKRHPAGESLDENQLHNNDDDKPPVNEQSKTINVVLDQPVLCKKTIQNVNIQKSETTPDTGNSHSEMTPASTGVGVPIDSIVDDVNFERISLLETVPNSSTRYRPRPSLQDLVHVIDNASHTIDTAMHENQMSSKKSRPLKRLNSSSTGKSKRPPTSPRNPLLNGSPKLRLSPSFVEQF